MEFEHSFSVAAPIDAVWAAMTDIERFAPCVPETRVTGRAGAASYNVEITVAVGPLATTVEGNITLAERDDARHREVLKVVAKDSDSDTPTDATLTIVLTQTAAWTDAAVHSSVEVSGIVALMGEEKIAEVAADTIGTFATNLETLLGQPPRQA